jgi:hypothetical protein
MKRYARPALFLIVALATGCVTRQYIITSDPPGALVYRNGQPIGSTPVEEHFVYYGKYHFRLVKDGYQTQEDLPELRPPWYEFPGIDAFSEIINPCKFRDIHRLHYVLTPLQPVRPDELKARAEDLRGQGRAIQAVPAPPPLVIPPRPPQPRSAPLWGIFGPGPSNTHPPTTTTSKPDLGKDGRAGSKPGSAGTDPKADEDEDDDWRYSRRKQAGSGANQGTPAQPGTNADQGATRPPTSSPSSPSPASSSPAGSSSSLPGAGSPGAP